MFLAELRLAVGLGRAARLRAAAGLQACLCSQLSLTAEVRQQQRKSAESCAVFCCWSDLNSAFWYGCQAVPAHVCLSYCARHGEKGEGVCQNANGTSASGTEEQSVDLRLVRDHPAWGRAVR